jgi:hypothetical protein
MSTIEGIKKRVDALAEKDGGKVVLIYRDPLQEAALAQVWPTWEQDTQGMSTQEIFGDPRYAEYECVHFAALAAAEREHGNIPIVLDAQDRNL